jgi:hypothetical protein
MSLKQWLLVLVICDFTALTVWAIVDAGGVIEAFAWCLSTVTGWQLMTDLSLSLLAAAVLIYADAQRLGLNPWPWIAACVLGSPGPLAYLVRREAALRTATPVTA